MTSYLTFNLNASNSINLSNISFLNYTSCLLLHVTSKWLCSLIEKMWSVSGALEKKMPHFAITSRLYLYGSNTNSWQLNKLLQEEWKRKKGETMTEVKLNGKIENEKKKGKWIKIKASRNRIIKNIKLKMNKETNGRNKKKNVPVNLLLPYKDGISVLNGWQLAKMKKSIPDMSLPWNL